MILSRTAHHYKYFFIDKPESQVKIQNSKDRIQTETFALASHHHPYFNCLTSLSITNNFNFNFGSEINF